MTIMDSMKDQDMQDENLATSTKKLQLDQLGHAWTFQQDNPKSHPKCTPAMTKSSF